MKCSILLCSQIFCSISSFFLESADVRGESVESHFFAGIRVKMWFLNGFRCKQTAQAWGFQLADVLRVLCGSCSWSLQWRSCLRTPGCTSCWWGPRFRSRVLKAPSPPHTAALCLCRSAPTVKVRSSPTDVFLHPSCKVICKSQFPLRNCSLKFNIQY